MQVETTHAKMNEVAAGSAGQIPKVFRKFSDLFIESSDGDEYTKELSIEAVNEYAMCQGIQQSVLPKGYTWTERLEAELPTATTWTPGLLDNLTFWGERAAKEYANYPGRKGAKAPIKVIEDALIKCHEYYLQMEHEVLAVSCQTPKAKTYWNSAKAKRREYLMGLLTEKGMMSDNFELYRELHYDG